MENKEREPRIFIILVAPVFKKYKNIRLESPTKKEEAVMIETMLAISPCKKLKVGIFILTSKSAHLRIIKKIKVDTLYLIKFFTIFIFLIVLSDKTSTDSIFSISINYILYTVLYYV